MDTRQINQLVNEKDTLTRARALKDNIAIDKWNTETWKRIASKLTEIEEKFPLTENKPQRHMGQTKQENNQEKHSFVIKTYGEIS